jgi:hypothetical protein
MPGCFRSGNVMLWVGFKEMDHLISEDCKKNAPG